MDEEAKPENDQPVESDQPDIVDEAETVSDTESTPGEADVALSEDPFAEPEEQPAQEPATDVPAEPSEPAVSGESGEAEVAAQVPETGDPSPTPGAEAPEASLDEMVASLRDDDGTADAAEPDTEAEASGDQAQDESVRSATEEAPAAAATDSAAAVESEESSRARRSRSARVPFYVYLGVWLVFSGVTAYLLWPIGSGSFVAHPTYGLLVLIGVALLSLGPLLALGSWWYASAHSEPDERVGLVRAVLLRSAAAMAGGVVLWWATLVVLDLNRAGLLG